MPGHFGQRDEFDERRLRNTRLAVSIGPPIKNMKGQWIGKCAGTNTGTVFLNVDEFPSCFQGVAYLIDDNTSVPGSAVFFKTANKEKKLQFHSNAILPIDKKTGLVSTWESIKQNYSADVRMPNHVDVTGKWDDASLEMTWTSDIGTSGTCSFPKSDAEKPSALVPSAMNWKEYKAYVAELEGKRFLFRGQNKPWRLRTSYHRTGRADLHRYLNEDIKILHKHLSGKTKHFFNLQNPDENGAFFNLVQHHGYPTPLLDWTYSPYVAVFFAYRGISNKIAAAAGPDKKLESMCSTKHSGKLIGLNCTCF